MMAHESSYDTSSATPALQDDYDDCFMPEYRGRSMVDGSRRRFARKVAAKLCNSNANTSMHDDPVRNSGDDPADAGMLCFCTFFTTSRNFSLEHTDTTLAKVLDITGQLLGFLQLDSGQELTDNPTLSMCIISFTGPGTGPLQVLEELQAAHSNNRPLEKNPEGLFDEDDELLGTGEAWNLLNIMLLRVCPEDKSAYSRVGLGVIHYKALRALDVNWASFKLK